MSNFKKFLALVLATLMVASAMVFTAPAAAAAEYAPTGDYAADIALLNSFGVMLGNGVDSFLEKENVTRWQMAILVAKVVTGDTTYTWGGEKSAYYSDVDASDYPEAIDFCHEMGYIRGTGDGKFDPDGYITYQDGLTLLVRLLGYETASITYPWGYILEARKLATTDGEYLTDEIDTGNKTPLLREEVANLVAKAIKINTATIVDGVAVPGKSTLLKTGLKAEDLGKATLVATWNASMDAKYTKPAYGKATFEYDTTDKDGNPIKDTVDVKVANISKTGEFALNDLLGFTADVISVRGVAIAAMSDICIVDSYTVPTSNEKTVKIGDVVISDIYKYGTTADAVFVANDANLSTKGRLIVCDINNDGIDKYDVARYIPNNTVTAIYMAENVAVTKAKGWKADTDVTVYYTANHKNDSNAAKDYTNNYVAGVVTKVPSKMIDKLNAAVRGVGTGLGGYNIGDGVSTGTDKVGRRTSFGDDSGKYAVDTNFYVSVIGDLKHGEVFLGNFTKVGDLTFINVMAPVEIASGTAVLGGTDNNTSVKLGDTLIPVGYDKTVSAVANTEYVKINGKANTALTWYNTFADVNKFDTDAANDPALNNYDVLVGSKVNYITVDGRVVAMSLYEKAADTYTSPYVYGNLILNIKADGKNVTLNADNTITVNVYNTDTMAYENVKLDQVNGTKLAQYVNSLGLDATARLILGTEGAKDIKTVADLVLAVLGTPAWTNTVDGYKLILAAVINSVDGVYSISTDNDDVNDIKRPAIVKRNYYLDSDNIGVDADVKFDITLTGYENSAISTLPAIAVGTHQSLTEDMFKFANKFLTVDKNTKIVVIANDGIATVTNTIPESGDMIKIDESKTFILALDNSNVILFTKDAAANVVTFSEAVSGTPVNTDGNWYTLTWNSKFVGTEVVVEEVAGKEVISFHYTFEKLRNLTTGAIESVVIVTDAYTGTPAKDFFGTAWYGEGTKTALASVADSNTKKVAQGVVDVATIYEVFYISAEGGIYESSMISWAKANGYEVGKLIGAQSGNVNYFPISNVAVDAVKNDQTGKWEYQLTTDGDIYDEKDVKGVIGYEVTIMNLSASITTDEIKVHTGSSISGDMCKKILGTLSTLPAAQKKAEFVFYKLNKDGTLEAVINMYDGMRSNKTVVADEYLDFVNAK